MNPQPQSTLRSAINAAEIYLTLPVDFKTIMFKQAIWEAKYENTRETAQERHRRYERKTVSKAS